MAFRVRKLFGTFEKRAPGQLFELESGALPTVLPTEYIKSRIYQMFVRAKICKLRGNASIVVISPLRSIFQDQLLEMGSLGHIT